MLFVNIIQAPFIALLTLGFCLIIVFTVRRKQKLRSLFFSPEQQKILTSSQIKGVSLIKTISLVTISFLLGIVLLDPRGSSLSSDIELEGMDIVFIYDISRSMDVQDVTPSRLEFSKQLGIQLLDTLVGNRIGLVAYAADAIRMLPLTTDVDSVSLFINDLSSDMISSQSTDIGKALDEALKNFQEDTLTHKTIILFTDGENLDGNTDKAITEIKSKGVSLFLVGVGTTTGGSVPIIDRRTKQTVFLTSLTGEQVISKLDEKYLEKLATQGDGKYFLGSRSTINEINILLENTKKSPFGTNSQNFLEPKFRIFILLALFALCLFLFLPERKKRSQALGMWLLLMILPNLSYSLTAERNGYSSYKNGEYSSALRFYQRSLIQNPKNEKAKIGEAASLYKLERGERSENSFLALTNSKDTKLAQQALFNAGNARIQKEDLDGALEIYKKVMAENPVDSRLYQKALNNYIYVRALQQQQQSQQPSPDDQNSENNNQEKSQDNQSQQDQNDDSKEQNNDQNGKSDDQQQSQQEPQKDQSPSKSISPSDIDNLLGVAEENEKANFSKQHKQQAGIFQQNKY